MNVSERDELRNEKGAQIMRKEGGAMKKLLLLGVGSALMFTMAGVGSAQADTLGPIHKSTSILSGTGAQLVSPGGQRCASCHRAHTAKAEMLLKDSQPALCYSCHGGAGTFLDVVDGVDPNSAAATNALRGGGFAYAKLDGAGATLDVGPIDPATGRNTYKNGLVQPLATGTAVTSRHQIDGVTTGTMWGNGAISSLVNPGKAGVTLECGSCHDPHGNGNYRILKSIPNDSADGIVLTPAVIAQPLAVPPVVGVAAVMGPAPVNIPDATGTRVYTTTNYWNVTDRSVPTVTGGAPPAAGVTDGYIANASQWCSTCHTRYLAQAPAYQTNSGDAVFTYRHTSNRIDKAGVGRPNCIQCHVSHGTNVAMTGGDSLVAAPDGVIPAAKGTAGVGSAPKTGADVVAIGTSRLLRVDNRGTCQMCHNK